MKFDLKKRNDLKNFIVLILLVFLSYFLELTPLKRFIGYHKIKEYVKIEYNIFPLAKGFFGDKIFYFYDTDKSVNSNIIKEEKYNNGYLVYLSDTNIYSNVIGSVIDIKKENEYYTILISGVNNIYVYKGLSKVEVSIYEKIEVKTLLGTTSELVYYYEKK